MFDTYINISVVGQEMKQRRGEGGNNSVFDTNYFYYLAPEKKKNDVGFFIFIKGVIISEVGGRRI